MLLIGWLVAEAATRRLRTLVCRAKSPKDNALPDRLHEVLPPSLLTGRRVLIVGDLHGCFDELQDLLAKCGYRPGEDVVVSVGDLVNKGPDSLAVLRWFAKGGPLVRAVRGNHEEAALASYRNLKAGRMPKSERYKWMQEMNADLAAYMAQLPLTLRLPSYRVVVVHAGLVPGVPLSQQHILDMMTMRNCVAIEAKAGEPGSASDSSGSASVPAAAEAAQAQGRAAAIEASGIPLSGSLSSLDMEDFELVATATIGSSSGGDDGSSTSGDADSSGSSGDGTVGGSSSGGSGARAGASGRSSSRAARLGYGGKLPIGQVRVQSEGLDWRQALLAYAQLGVASCGAGKAQRQPVAGDENSPPPAQQQQQQQQQQQHAVAPRKGAQPPAAAAGQQVGDHSAAEVQAVELKAQQSAAVGQPQLVGTDVHTMGVPWARAWSDFQRAAPQRHAWVTYGCKHAVFGHDARRLLQLERCATGLDGGVVYGNTLYCLLLPPLGEHGQPLLDQAGAPPDAQQIRLCGGLPAYIVGVPARQAYAPTH